MAPRKTSSSGTRETVVVDDLRELWEEHLAAEFPTSAKWAPQCENVDPVLLDADVAGVVSFRLTGSKLSVDQERILHPCIRSLDLTLNRLPIDAQPYFHRLRRLALLAVG